MQGPLKIPFLKTGDEIRIVAPASAVERSYIESTFKSLELLDFRPSLGKNVFSVFNQFAGTDEQRRKDFQQALDDVSVKAIFCARGGYGSIRILDSLDFKSFRKTPKWIVGFSDITLFHLMVNQEFGLPTIHAPMPVNFSNRHFPEHLRHLKNILQGETQTLAIKGHTLNTEGHCRGKLIGGNLSILYSLQATPYELDTREKILFIEDVGEQLYHLDRIMQNFTLSGKLKELKGLIVGGLTAMKDKKRPFGKKAEEIVHEYVRGLDIPVVFGFPAGHMENNLPFVLGGEISLEVSKQFSKLHFLT
jgi:muramoyltetrapeptide carboxypeptidase